ncbi:hypothetical protein [Pseudomonas sp. GV071]|uniref:hypothetical protein n=1 Tax=Pseudomonas sp. GV071 TaxID=2135754 RepID=UPI000D34B91C|nr:hypothetical protein [Pseudomonas sp. GV071]PTQ74151.1 hypothetical protein C8K61_101591 [Pseudomonas sp. GV071]
MDVINPGPQLRYTILILTSVLCFAVTLLAAMKASVYGHLYGQLRWVVLPLLSLAPLLVWLLCKPMRNPDFIDFSRQFYTAMFTAIVLALVALIPINLLSPQFVSARSYRSISGSFVFLLIGGWLWRVAVLRRYLKKSQLLERRS